MMERIAACPIDEADVGIGSPLAVVVVARSRIEQAVGDARRRDCAVERVRDDFHRRRRKCQGSLGDSGRGTVAKSEAAARKPDLAERASEQDQGPIGLLAVLGALERP
jgi:hypothetical protein